jgi:hypothetical protein
MTRAQLADRREGLALARQAPPQVVESEAALHDGGHVPNADDCACEIPVIQSILDRLTQGGVDLVAPSHSPPVPCQYP